MDFIQLKYKDVKILKEELHKKQSNICPLLGVEFDADEMVLDHKHKRKDDPIGIDGDGLVRGAVHKFANRLEGKVSKFYVRYAFGRHIDLPSLLRNLADYLENPPCDQKYIHPTEKKKEKKLGKRVFNKIKKEYSLRNPKKKELEYPASKKPTKIIKELAAEYNIEL